MKNMTRIVLDPGIAPKGSAIATLNDPLTLDICQRVERKLRAAGLENVTLTRTDAEGKTAAQRAKLGRGAAVYLWLNFNADDNPKAQGTETYFHPQANAGSQQLAELLQPALARALGRTDRGVQVRRYEVLFPFTKKGVTTAAVLVAPSFLSDPDEARRLKQEPYRNAIADTLALGILRFLQQPEVPASARGPVDGGADGGATGEGPAETRAGSAWTKGLLVGGVAGLLVGYLLWRYRRAPPQPQRALPPAGAGQPA